VGHRNHLSCVAARRAALAIITGLAIGTAAVSQAAAQARPSLATMGCAEASRLVASRGSVLLSTGPHLYDRYVANSAFCEKQDTQPAWERTADQAQCLVGYVCRPRFSNR
jgi:hypothetical protein